MSKSKGVLLTILSASSFGFIPLFAKIAYANGFNPFTFSLFRSAFASVEIFLLLKIKNIDYTIDKGQYFILFKASLVGYCFTMITLVISYNYMATGLATTLHFIYPVAVMVGSILVFKEKIKIKTILALITSLIGIYLLSGFGSSNSVHLVGALLALASGIFYAYYILVIAYSSLKSLNSFVLAFYISLFNAYILLAGTLITGNFGLNYNYTALLSTVIVALIANLVGIAALQAGLKTISATTATILSTFEPLTSIVIGILILNEVLMPFHIVGSSLVIISVIIAAFSEKKISRKAGKAVPHQYK